VNKLILATFLFILACQTAKTQQRGTADEATAPAAAPTGTTDELPRVSDQKDVTLEPKVEEPKKEVKIDALKETVKKYSNGDSIKIDLIKVSKLKMLNRVDEYKGQAFLKGKNKLRIEFSEPIKSVAVLNGKRAWVIEYPPKDVDDKVRISKFNLAKTPGQSQLLVTSILSSGNLMKTFKVEKTSSLDGKIGYSLTPKKPVEEIKALSMVIDEKKQEITELKYFDPIDNETTFTFVTTSFGANLAASLFEYSAPKGAEVNEF
jgi:outer membrane lipoprotein-sorting protein